MVQAAFGGMQQPAGVLAAVAVAFADVAGVQLGTPAGHLREVDGDNHGGHADRTPGGADGLVTCADGAVEDANKEDHAFVARIP